jgi:hypothetical protein
MKIKYLFKTEASRNILQRTSFALIRDRIHHKRWELDRLTRELYQLHLRLAGRLTHHDWNVVDISTAAQACLTLCSTTTTKENKFDRLLAKKSREGVDTKKVVVNLSDKALESAAVKIFSKGLNYAQTTNRRTTLRTLLAEWNGPSNTSLQKRTRRYGKK